MNPWRDAEAWASPHSVSAASRAVRLLALSGTLNRQLQLQRRRALRDTRGNGRETCLGEFQYLLVARP
jgi:hypothetical protein